MRIIERSGQYRFIPEKWSEYFKIYIAGILVKGYKEGAYYPPFYLPVAQPWNKDAYELWIIPLAPFVWLLYLIIALSSML